MQKKYIVTIIFIMVAGVILVLGILYFNLPPNVVTEDFEGDIEEWSAKGQLPEDPNSPGHPVQWHVGRVSNISRSGMHAMELFIDGRQDDGTIWLQRKISAGENKRIRVNVSFWFYSEQESFNALAAVVAYVGSAGAQIEEDFAVVGAANEAAGWKDYVYTSNLATDQNGEVWVAVGISVRWETYMTYYIDDVKIEFA